MTNPYTTQTIANYNTSPPADDASAVASNQVFWQKHLDKIGDPLKVLSEGINTELLSAFSKLDLNLIRAITANDTQLAADERKLISATNTITYTLLAAVTAGDGFTVTVLNAGTGVVTIDANLAELINGAPTIALSASAAVKLRCNAVGWDIAERFDPVLTLRDGSELTIATGSITPTAGYHAVDTEADAATDDLTDIVTTNIPDGGVLVIRAIDATHDVVVKHTASGANKIVIAAGADLTLDDAVKSITLQRRGDHWEEVGQALGGSPGRLIGFQSFTASGTWTPTAGTNSIEVEIVGGGGGGGGANGSAVVPAVAGGGGAGERAIKRITSFGATETVTIGAGGTAGAATPTNGGVGGTTSLGTLVTAIGGSGGVSATTGEVRRGGIGGTGGTGADLAIPGQGGGTGGLRDTVEGTGGNGGGDGGGSGGQGLTGSNGASGGGGGGAGSISNISRAGGAGGAGYIIIREYS